MMGQLNHKNFQAALALGLATLPNTANQNAIKLPKPTNQQVLVGDSFLTQEQTIPNAGRLLAQTSEVNNKFTPVVFRTQDANDNKDSVIDKTTQAKINTSTKQLITIKDLITKEEPTPTNAETVAQRVYETQVSGLMGKIMPGATKEQIQKVSKILTAAQAQGLPEADLAKLIKRLAHLSGGIDITEKNGKTSLENLKETHPDAVAYEASTRLFQALDEASKTLPKTADKTALFKAALENGIAFDMYVTEEDRLAGKISPEAKQLTKNIAEIVSSLDDKTKAAVFKAAGYLMNWQTPMRVLEASLKAGTAAEDKTFEKIMGALQNSVDKEAQEKIFIAFLNHANENYFEGKLDQATLNQIAKTQDPLRLLDSDTQAAELESILNKLITPETKPEQATAVVNTLLAVASGINNPNFYLSNYSIDFKSTVSTVEAKEAAARLKAELGGQ